MRTAEAREKRNAQRRAWGERNKERLREKFREWQSKNRGHRTAYMHEWWIKKLYGLSIDGYREILAAQGGACAICGGPPGTKRFAVDHDHRTGKVRGLLCSMCNTALERIDSVDGWVARATAYLNKGARHAASCE